MGKTVGNQGRECGVTVYFRKPLVFTAAEQVFFEQAIGCEISEVSDTAMNLYTHDPDTIQSFVDLVGGHYISEIAGLKK